MADQPEEAWQLTPAVDPWADQDTLSQPGADPPTLAEPTLAGPTLAEPRTPPLPPALLPPALLPPALLPPALLPPTAPLSPTPPADRRRRFRRTRPTAAGIPAPRPAGGPATGPAGIPAPRPAGGPASGPAGGGAPRPVARPAARQRRRRRWPRNLLALSLLSVACCCGVPGYLAWPVAQQYPAVAVLPSAVADLRLRDDAATRRAADRLAEQLLDVNLVADDVFAGVYRDGSGKRVTLFGMTGLRLTPGTDLEAEMRHLAERYELTGVQPFDLGEAGAHERCGVGRTSGDAVVVCGWADHGSLGTAVLTRRSIDESADLVRLLRESVVTRG